MKKILSFLGIVILIVIILLIMQSRNFYGLSIGLGKGKTSHFSRDKHVTYNHEDSYKIESNKYSDAMYYKKIKVNKNSIYKVSCMVKTKDVVCENGSFGGFNICLMDKIEKSESISGTNDWTKLNFYFHSYNNTSAEVGFRLGENSGDCKGTVWIADLNIEESKPKKSKDWNFAVFIIDNVDANLKNQKFQGKISSSEKNSIVRAFNKFKTTCEEFSNDNMDITFQIFEIDDTIKTISEDSNSVIALTQKDVYDSINKYVYDSGYTFDHIFVVANLGDNISRSTIDWLGLGGILYDSIGFSNIRISSELLSAYLDSSSNSFSEEVFLHEFLHTLERNMQEMGNDIIKLHDYDQYGYKNKAREGLRSWYKDYMSSSISPNKIALTDEVYYSQPLTEDSFRNAYKLENEFHKNANIAQRICEAINKLF